MSDSKTQHTKEPPEAFSLAWELFLHKQHQVSVQAENYQHVIAKLQAVGILTADSEQHVEPILSESEQETDLLSEIKNRLRAEGLLTPEKKPAEPKPVVEPEALAWELFLHKQHEVSVQAENYQHVMAKLQAEGILAQDTEQPESVLSEQAQTTDLLSEIKKRLRDEGLLATDKKAAATDTAIPVPEKEPVAIAALTSAETPSSPSHKPNKSAASNDKWASWSWLLTGHHTLFHSGYSMALTLLIIGTPVVLWVGPKYLFPPDSEPTIDSPLTIVSGKTEEAPNLNYILRKVSNPQQKAEEVIAQFKSVGIDVERTTTDSGSIMLSVIVPPTSVFDASPRIVQLFWDYFEFDFEATRHSTDDRSGEVLKLKLFPNKPKD